MSMEAQMYYGDDFEYAHRRLSSSVVMHNSGSPILVLRVFPKISTSPIKAGVIVLGNGDEEVEVDLQDIVLEVPPLGYVNHSKGVSYLTRKPVRKFKQGLSRENIVVSSGTLGRDFNWHLLRPCLKNEYPTFARCLESARGKKALAFSRDFAITKDLSLEYRGRVVGAIQDETPVLAPKYFFLSEVLQIAKRG